MRQKPRQALSRFPRTIVPLKRTRPYKTGDPWEGLRSTPRRESGRKEVPIRVALIRWWSEYLLTHKGRVTVQEMIDMGRAVGGSLGFRWEFQGHQPMRCRFREWEASEFGDRNLASVEIAGKDGTPFLFTIRVPTVLAKQLNSISEGDDITILWKGKKPGRMGEYHDFATYNHDAKADDSLPPGLQGADEIYEAWLQREMGETEEGD